MSEQTADVRPDPKPQGLLSRFFGVILSPRETFAGVVAHPEWLGMLVLVVVVTGSLAVWFQTTEVGRQASVDAAVRGMEAFGMKVSDQMYDRIQKSIMDASALQIGLRTGVSIIVMSPLINLALAGILFAVFSAGLGGTATFKQVFATIVHAGVISVLAQFFTVPLNYVRGSMTGATNLGVLLPMLTEGSFPARFLGMVDLFTVWWVAVVAVGLAVVYRRRTGPIALSLFSVYAVIAAGIAAFQAFRSAS